MAQRLREIFAADRKCLIDANEPLLGGAEDDRLLAAPVVRIAVRDLFLGEEQARIGKMLGDQFIGFPDRFAADPLRNRIIEPAAG